MGAVLGQNEGMYVGDADGGVNVGKAVGIRVGAVVGSTDGAIVGEADGI